MEHMVFVCGRTPRKKPAILKPENAQMFVRGDVVIRRADKRAGLTYKTGTVLSVNPVNAKVYVAWKARPKLGSTNGTFRTTVKTSTLVLVSRAGAPTNAE